MAHARFEPPIAMISPVGVHLRLPVGVERNILTAVSENDPFDMVPNGQDWLYKQESRAVDRDSDQNTSSSGAGSGWNHDVDVDEDGRDQTVIKQPKL